MTIDYVEAERVVELSFGRLDRSAKLQFPDPGSLSYEIGMLLGNSGVIPLTLPHEKSSLFASAAVEMWHRAIHSFLLSVALTKYSPLWASVTGYYSSHFVMRAFAHSMGIFKSFLEKELIQIVAQGGQLVCTPLVWGKKSRGEHPFYWKAVKNHPRFIGNDLFKENSERDMGSESSHRTYANYIDHINQFVRLGFASSEELADEIDRIGRIRLHSVTSPSRDGYPDLHNVQILAFHRIIAFQDYLDERVPKNRFWRTHRRPGWCSDVMLYQIEEQDMDLSELS